MNHLLRVLAALIFAAACSLAQSPNLKESGIRLNATDFQTRSEEGLANGYAPLNGSVLVPPQYLFPNFTSGAVPVGTIWVKGAGDTLAPLSGVTLTGSTFTLGNVTFGEIDTARYGVKIGSGAFPLYLKGGTGNRVYVDYQNSIGAANAGRTDYTWFVGPTGTFKFAGGEIGGAVDFNGFNATEIGTFSGTGLTTNYSTATITSSSGNVTVTAPVGNGLVIPSTGSQANASFALNAAAANLLYGRIDAINTWAAIQTFTLAPVVPNNSFTIAKVTGLQTDLDSRLKKDGSLAMTGALAMGGFKVTGAANPTAGGDLVTLSYLQANYPTSAVASLTAAVGTPIQLSAATGAVTITMPPATSSDNGFLSSANFTTFNNKENTLTFNAPLNRGGNTISLPLATSIANGYLSSADWQIFNGKENALTFGLPFIRTVNAIALPKATSVQDGYLDADDFAAFFNSSTLGMTNGQLLIGNTTLNGGAGGATKASLTSSDSSHLIVVGAGSIDLKYPTGFADGQFLIGSAATNTLQKGYITAGSGILVTNSAGGIQIAAVGGPGTGDASTNTATSIDSEIALFSGTTGKVLKRAGITGMAKVTGGVLSAGVAGTDYTTAASAETFTNKTFDSQGASNTFKYLEEREIYPSQVDGVGATLNTTSTGPTYDHVVFSATADEAGNYALYRFVVPFDLDTATDLAAMIKIRLGGADTGKHAYKIAMAEVADSSSADSPTFTNSVNMFFNGDASGASGDEESVGYVTLTNWRISLTGSRTIVVKVSRDGDDVTNDTSGVSSSIRNLVIKFGHAQ